MRTLLRSLLVVLALAGGLREAGAAACQSLCPWGALVDFGSTAAATEPSCGGCADADASDCALPCAPDVPCPLFAPSPPALDERPIVSLAQADHDHATVGPAEVLPGSAGASADVDPDAARVETRGTSAARVARGVPLWLRDRALLI